MPTNRANVLDDELMRLVKQTVKQVMASHQPRPEPGRKRRGGGAPDEFSDLTNFAYVTVAATSDGGSIGKAVRLNTDMEPVGPDGNSMPVTSGPGYDPEQVEKMEIEFKSSDFVDAAVGKRVLLHYATEIEPGAEWENQKVRGTLVEYAADENLTCATIEVVTDVACVDDEIVVTTEEIEYVSGPCP